jgi:hypothetical protein
MKRFKKDDTYHIVYDSLADFFANTDPNKPPADMHSSNEYNHREVKSSERQWRFGNDNTRENFYEKRTDPNKGRGICADAVKRVMADKSYKSLIKQAITHRKRIKYEDHGFRLNVSKAISGEDRIFGVYKNSRKPTVKIAINICGSACVGQDDFINVAKTAIPTIYALETAGISTEVYYTAFASGTHEDSADYTGTHVLIKSAQQRFSWATFAPVFCLGSYRESIFLSWIYSKESVSGGLGRPMENYQLERKDNYGYTSIIGLNAVGPASVVKEIFKKIKNKEC